MIKSTPNDSFEQEQRLAGKHIIIGIDEAGRGPLAGNVVAAAVILPQGYILEGLNDSKKLTEKRRDALYKQLMTDSSVLKAIGIANAAEIDALNILRATHLAMQRAAEELTKQLGTSPDICLIDGLPVKNFPYPQLAIIKGDSKSLSIAAASILAKVTRDKQMYALALQYPQYGFDKHKGYGTKAHMNALMTYGPTPLHRRSFAPVAQASLSSFQ